MHPLLSSEPTSIGDYRLLSRLGAGAMGAVYLGRSRSGRMVAVKLVRAELADDAEFRERFRREVDAARSVGGFWTAAVVDADPDAPQPWLATEYVPGPTLHQVVSEHGPLPEHTVRNLAAGLAEALQAIHRAGLVHRDLKPANVLLGPDGPRVIDFGISRAMAATSMTATGMFMGTPGFFSPEQTSDKEVGPPSDVFSLGAVLAFAATGAYAFGNESTPVMLYRVVHSAPDLAAVPHGLLGVVTACLNKDPAQRPTPAGILDMVGEVHPEGNHWLPAAIQAAIDEHTERLRRSMVMPEVATPAPSPPPSSPPRSGTRPDHTPVESVSVPEATDEMPPVRPMPPPTQGRMRPPAPSWPSAPPIHRDLPGPVFSTGGRVTAVVWAVLLVIPVFAGYEFQFSNPRLYRSFFFKFHPLWLSFYYTDLLLQIVIALLVLRALVPALRLKISGGGLRVSRLWLAREFSWRQIERVGVVGHGRRQSIAFWVPAGVRPPESLWWHWVRRYHGGVRVFPIGATGGRGKRRHEVDRVRLALQQYATRVYDNRLL